MTKKNRACIQYSSEPNLNIKTSCRALYYETALEQKNKSERERDALNIGDL